MDRKIELVELSIRLTEILWQPEEALILSSLQTKIAILFKTKYNLLNAFSLRILYAFCIHLVRNLCIL